MIASVKKTAQSANELSLGISTILTYRINILEKMRLKSNACIIHAVIEYKIETKRTAHLDYKYLPEFQYSILRCRMIPTV